MPVYQQANTLSTLLACLRQQTYRSHFEVLVCDDGSGPEILQAIREFQDLDARYIWQPDLGYRLARSRNNAIRCAAGEILVFLDGDHLVGPEFLAGHAEAHDTAGRQLVCGTRKLVPVTERARKSDLTWLLSRLQAYPRGGQERANQERWIGSSSPWMVSMGGNFSVRRAPEVVFDEAFVGWGPEDRELACRLAYRSGYRIVPALHIEAFHLIVDRHFNSANPLITRKSDEIAALLRNSLYFFSLYPDLDIRPVMKILLYCHLNSDTDTWFAATPRSGRSIEDLIEEAAQWMRRHGVNYLPETRACSSTQPCHIAR